MEQSKGTTGRTLWRASGGHVVVNKLWMRSDSCTIGYTQGAILRGGAISVTLMHQAEVTEPEAGAKLTSMSGYCLRDSSYGEPFKWCRILPGE
jgi:hypothetical protein